MAEKLVLLTRELGKFPTEPELGIKHQSDKSFPIPNTFRNRLGKKAERAAFIKTYCEERGGMEDVIELCIPHIRSAPKLPKEDVQDVPSTGYVYMVKHGTRKEYKIGRTTNPDQRMYRLDTLLPEVPQPIHSIKTDDPVGVERYWHNRFKEKRMPGTREWYKLDANDIKIFKKMKFP